MNSNLSFELNKIVHNSGSLIYSHAFNLFFFYLKKYLLKFNNFLIKIFYY